MKYSILQSCALVLAACLMVPAAPAEARPPWGRAGRDAAGGAPGLAQILVQARGQMSDADRERLRRDLAAPQRDRGRGAAAPSDARRMTPQQRESLRRDMRDANRQLDSQRRGERSRGGNGNDDRDRGRR